MKIEQITALKDAGFTAEQIVALAPILTDETPKQDPPEAGPPEAGPPEAGPPEAGAPEAGPPEAGAGELPMVEMMSAMQKQFKDMMKAVQGAMINGSRQTETEMTAADVAASILDPGRNRSKK